MCKTFKDEDYSWVKCPCCGANLQFLTGSEFAIAHLKAHMESQAEAHPEVSEEQLDLPTIDEIDPK